MATKNQAQERGQGNPQKSGEDALRYSRMMAHLLDALEKKTDIGEYGRLTFVIVARHFLSADKIVQLIADQPGMSEESGQALLAQVEARDYNPPTRQRILQWQSQQDFPICPDPDDPNACNVYKTLEFPQQIYDRIGEFWEEKSEARESEG